MRNIIKREIGLLIIFTGAIMLINSCTKYKLVQDDKFWPDQLIYMPAAVYNNYTINSTPAARGADPTPGYPVQFLVDTIGRKLNVILGVYRSGKDNAGTFNVDIAVNNDTINKLLAISGKLPAGTVLLTADKYTVPPSVVVNDGNDVAEFDLSINLDSLKANFPNKIYAIAVGISSTQRKTNPKFATTIILFYTKLMKPTASFTNANSTVAHTINFTNTSLYGMKSIWDFGDGSGMTTTADVNVAVSHTYSAAGTFTVTLKVQGAADWADRSVFSKSIVVP